MPPRRRCPTCGSKQWHKEPSSGLIACSEGHILQNYRSENNEAEEMGPHTLRKRALKSGRKKREGLGRADPRLYHGARARFLYFQCLQLLLRKQIGVLTRLWVLPPEFEIVCKDVWALHLNLLPNPPLLELDMGEGDKKEGGDMDVNKDDAKALTPESQPPKSPVSPDNTRLEEEGSDGEDRDDKSSEDEDEDEDEQDAELAALLQENSDISSSEGEDTESRKVKQKQKSKQKYKRGKGHYVYEGPPSTIAVMIVAFWIMRIPVLGRDLTQLIESYELPYLDPIPRQLLPASMVVHLTKHNIQALSPYHTPSTMTLHVLASRLSKLMRSSYGIFTPEANAAPILWRVTSQALGGTPTLYGLIKRLSHVLSLPLTLHYTLAPGLEQLKGHDPTRHKYDNVPPELGFIGAGVVILKMAYGLDGRQRLPRDPDDPACALPRVEEYLQVLAELEDEDRKTKGAIFDSKSSMCAGDLEDEMTDRYLDFCEQALISGDDTRDTVLSNYFPLSKRANDPKETRITGGEGKERRTPLTATLQEGEGEKGLRPGEAYRVYNERDVAGTVPSDYEKVLRRGARWAGVDEELLGGVVENYERRIIRWWETKKRRDRESANMNITASRR